MATTPPPLDPSTAQSMIGQYKPQDESGMTQMAPQMPQQQQRQTQSHSQGIVALVQQISQKIGARKQRETEQTFDRFTQSAKGVQQAKAQMDEAQAKIKANPQDPDAIKSLKSAQEAMQQNQTILNDMFSGPHGEKHAKLLSKGFGIDDKNADTPERKAAMKAIQKSMGVGEGPARILSQIPQTQQLSPDAQRQQQLQQAGVVGKPPSGNALLQSSDKEASRQQQMAIEQLKQANMKGVTLDKMKMIGTLKGIDVSRDAQGQLVTHIMSPEERAKVPYLKAQDDLTAARTEAERAMADAKTNPNNPEMRIKMMNAQSSAVDAQARMLTAQAAQMRAMAAQAKESPEVAAARLTADRMDTELSKAEVILAKPQPTPTDDMALVASWVRAQNPQARSMSPAAIEQALQNRTFGTRISKKWEEATRGSLDPEFRQEMVDSIKNSRDAARNTAQKYDVQKESEAVGDDDILKGLDALGK
jgi:hypothetical protein